MGGQEIDKNTANDGFPCITLNEALIELYGDDVQDLFTISDENSDLESYDPSSDDPSIDGVMII